jgi:peptidyl-prolyl cis-trans isomerase SurA
MMSTHRRCFAVFALALAGSALVSAQPFAAPLAAPAPTGAVSDGLNSRFANGIAAIAEEKVITVDDVRREIGQYAAQIQREARNEKEFNDKLEALQDSVIQDLIDKVLIIKEFKKEKDGKEARHIPESFIDNKIADILSEQFDNDRSKFLAYLRSRGQTIREFRKDQEEDIIYRYMTGQQRKSQSLVSPVRIETFYRENKDHFVQEDSVHLRMIQLAKNDDLTTDAQLVAKANEIAVRFRAGTSFADLAKEFSVGTTRLKGGESGWMNRTSLKKEFSDPLFLLKKGDISEPLVTADGCFLLFAEDRKYAGTQSIDEVRDQIERTLVTQMARSNQERWLERLRRNGYVKHY